VKKVAKRPVLAPITNAKSTRTKKRKHDDADTLQAIEPRAKKTVKACITNSSKARKWCAKAAAGDINSVQQKFLDERTAAMQHELLKAGTSALAEGTSILNRLQQDKAIQEGSAWLKELQPYMGRMMKNYQLRVQCNSASTRAEIDAGKLPLTERLLQPYWDCGCDDVFLIFYPPMALLDGDWNYTLRLPVGGDFSKGSETGYSIAVAAFNKHRDWEFQPHDPCMVLTPGQAAKQLRMVDKDPAQLVPQRIVFESTLQLQGALPHQLVASEGWWANADGRGLTTTYLHEVLRGEERTGDTGAWAVSIIATGMPAN
jgi:hypothetical protein